MSIELSQDRGKIHTSQGHSTVDAAAAPGALVFWEARDAFTRHHPMLALLKSEKREPAVSGIALHILSRMHAGSWDAIRDDRTLLPPAPPAAPMPENGCQEKKSATKTGKRLRRATSRRGEWQTPSAASFHSELHCTFGIAL